MNPTAEELLNIIHHYDDTDNFGDMVDLADDALKLYPENPDFWAARARGNYQMDFSDEEAIAEALKRDAHHPVAMQLQAYALLDDNEPEKALLFVEEGLKHRPDAYALLIARAWINRSSGHIEAAISDWEKAVTVAPNLSRARCNLASHLVKLGRIDEAERWWREAAASQPDNGLFAYNLGTFLQEQERYEEAQPHFDRGRELLGEQNAIQHNRAINLKYLSRYEEAMDEWKLLISRVPDWEWPLEGVMDTLILLKRYDEAAVYAKKLDNVLGGYEGQLLMAEECYRQAAYERSLTVLQTLPIGSYAEDPRVWYWLGWLHLDGERYKEAVSYFQKAVELDDEREHAFFGFAKALFKLERFEEALAAVTRAIELDANDERYPDLRIQILSNLGQWSAMLAASEALIAERGDEDYAHSMRAIALKQLGRYKEAAAEYRTVARICDNEDDAEGAEKALGRAAECDEKAKANGFLARVLKLFGIQ